MDMSPVNIRENVYKRNVNGRDSGSFGSIDVILSSCDKVTSYTEYTRHNIVYL